jgi:hypothetical protein
MLAGFMWLAFAFSGGKQNDDYGHGYGGYSRRKRAFDDDEGKAWIIEDQILFLYCKSIIYCTNQCICIIFQSALIILG